MTTPVWAVIVEGELDATWQTKAQADREAKDLRAMDCGKVTVRGFESEALAYSWADKRRGR